MNSIIQMGKELTMGTREIAEMLEKNHSDIKRSADRLSAAGILTQPLAELPFEYRGNTYTEYRLGKRDCFVLVAQNSPEFTAKIVDRWQELEAKQAAPSLPNFADPVAAARAWADAVEQKQEAEKKLALAAPKVEFVDRYVESSGDLGFRQVAKLLKANENEFRGWLIAEKIMYRLGKNLTPMANHIEAGRFNTYVGSVQHGDSGHSWAQAKFTAKGVEWIAAKWAQYKIKAALTGVEE